MAAFDLTAQSVPTQEQVDHAHAAALARRTAPTLPVTMLETPGRRPVAVDASRPGVLREVERVAENLYARLLLEYPREMVLACRLTPFTDARSRVLDFLGWDAGWTGDPRAAVLDLLAEVARRRGRLRAAGHSTFAEYLAAGGTDLPWRVVLVDLPLYTSCDDFPRPLPTSGGVMADLLRHGPDAGVVVHLSVRTWADRGTHDLMRRTQWSLERVTLGPGTTPELDTPGRYRHLYNRLTARERNMLRLRGALALDDGDIALVSLARALGAEPLDRSRPTVITGMERLAGVVAAKRVGR